MLVLCFRKYNPVALQRRGIKSVLSYKMRHKGRKLSTTPTFQTSLGRQSQLELDLVRGKVMGAFGTDLS